jgi:hypothetical protein
MHAFLYFLLLSSTILPVVAIHTRSVYLPPYLEIANSPYWPFRFRDVDRPTITDYSWERFKLENSPSRKFRRKVRLVVFDSEKREIGYLQALPRKSWYFNLFWAASAIGWLFLSFFSGRLLWTHPFTAVFLFVVASIWHHFLIRYWPEKQSYAFLLHDRLMVAQFYFPPKDAICVGDFQLKSSFFSRVKFALAVLAGIPVSIFTAFFGLIPAIGVTIICSIPLFFATEIKMFFFSYLFGRFLNKEYWWPRPGGFNIPDGWEFILRGAIKVGLFIRHRKDPITLAMLAADIAVELKLISKTAESAVVLVDQLKQQAIDASKASGKDSDYFSYNPSASSEHIDPKGAQGVAIATCILIIFACVLGIPDRIARNFQASALMHDIVGKINDMKSFRDNSLPFCREMINVLYKAVTGHPGVLIPALDGPVTEALSALKEEIHFFETVAHPSTLGASDVQRLLALVQNLSVLHTESIEKRCAPAITLYLATSKSFMRHMLNTVGHKLLQFDRPHTLGVLLMGPAGTGKSTLPQYIATTVGKALDLDPAIGNFVAGKKFDDAYHGEFFAMADESLSGDASSEIALEEGIFLKNDVNHTTFLSRQAESYEKKIIAWVNRILMLTTNRTNPRSVVQYFSKTCTEEAVVRRLPFVVSTERIRVRTDVPPTAETLDLFYDDLKLYNWGTDTWHKIKLSALVHSIVVHAKYHDDVFRNRKNVSYDVKTIQSFGMSSHHNTNFDLAPVVNRYQERLNLLTTQKSGGSSAVSRLMTHELDSDSEEIEVKMKRTHDNAFGDRPPCVSRVRIGGVNLPADRRTLLDTTVHLLPNGSVRCHTDIAATPPRAHVEPRPLVYYPASHIISTPQIVVDFWKQQVSPIGYSSSEDDAPSPLDPLAYIEDDLPLPAPDEDIELKMMSSTDFDYINAGENTVPLLTPKHIHDPVVTDPSLLEFAKANAAWKPGDPPPLSLAECDTIRDFYVMHESAHIEIPPPLPPPPPESAADRVERMISRALDYTEGVPEVFWQTALGQLFWGRIDNVAKTILPPDWRADLMKTSVLSPLCTRIQRDMDVSTTEMVNTCSHLVIARFAKQKQDECSTLSYRVLEKVRNNYPLLGSLVVGAALFVAGGAALVYFNRAIAEPIETKSFKPDPKQQHSRNAKRHAVPRARLRMMDVEPVESKATAAVVTSFRDDDLNARNAMAAVYRNNVYKVDYIRGTSSTSQHLLALGGNRVISTAHMFPDILEGSDTIRLTSSYGNSQMFLGSRCKFHDAQLVVHGHSKDNLEIREDAMYVDLPAPFPDRKYLYTKILPYEKRSVLPFSDVLFMIDGEPRRARILSTQAPASTEYPRLGKRCQLHNTIKIEGFVPKGACGLPVFLCNPNVSQKLIGIIVGGTSTTTTVSLLDPDVEFTSDKEEDELTGQEIPTAILEDTEEIEMKSLKVGRQSYPVPHGFNIWGRVKPEWRTATYSTTKLRQTPFNNWSCPNHTDAWQCHHTNCKNGPKFDVPPPGSPFELENELVDPVYKSLTKHQLEHITPPSIGDMSFVEFATPLVRDYATYLIPPPAEGVPVMLTEEESINGFRRVDGKLLIPALEPHTAIGLPLVNEKTPRDDPHPLNQYVGKSRFLKCPVHGNIGRCEEGCKRKAVYGLRTQIDKIQDELRHRKVPFVVFQRFNKDEVREAKKWIRTILCSPAAFSIVLRMYLGGLFSGVVLNSLESVIAVGMNVHSRAYHEFIIKLRDFGSRGGSGDRSSADLSNPAFNQKLTIETVLAAADAYFKWDSEEERIEWRVHVTLLLLALIDPLIVVGDQLIQIVNSVVTGNPITDKKNSIEYANQDLLAWAYWRKQQNLSYTVREYTQFMLRSQYGDDFVNVLNDDVEGWSNLVHAKLLQMLFGVKMTPPVKNSVMVAYEDPLQMEYLKRTPVYHSGGYHAALRKESVLRPLMYCRDTSLPGLAQVCDSVLTELYESGDRKEFDAQVQEFRAFFARESYVWHPLTWQDLHDRWAYESEATKEPHSYNFMPEEAYDIELKSESIVSSMNTTTSPLAEPVAQLTKEAMVRPTEDAGAITFDALTIFKDSFQGIPVPIPAAVYREIYVATMDFTTALASGTALGTIDFPYDVILAALNVGAFLVGTKYFRSRCKLILRTNGPPFSTGSFILSCLPGYAPTANYGGDIYKESQMNCIYVSLATANGVEYHIPYMWTYPWIDVADMATTRYSCGKVVARVVCPFLSAGPNGPASQKIQVFAQLEDVEVCGYDPSAVLPMGVAVESLFRKRLTTAVAQAQHPPGRELPIAENITLKSTQYPSDFRRAREDLKYRGGKSKLTFQEDWDLNHNDPVPMKKEKHVRIKRAPIDRPAVDVPLPVNSEAKAKTSSVLAGTNKATTPILGDIINGITSLFGIVGNTISNIAPHAGSIIGGVAKVAPFMADMPTDERPPKPVAQVDGEFAATRGLMITKSLSTFPAARTAPSLAGTPDILELSQRPALIDVFTISSATAAKAVIFNLYCCPRRMCHTTRTGAGPFAYNYWHSMASYYSRFFRLWRGSCRFVVFVETTGMTSLVVRFMFLPPGSSVPADPEVSGGDLPSVIMEFRGPGYYAVEVPYQQKLLWSQVGPICYTTNAESTGSLGGRFVATVVTPPITTDTTGNSNVCFVVFGAMGPDYQLAEYWGPTNIWTTSAQPTPAQLDRLHDWVRDEEHAEEIELKCSLAGMFAGEFQKLSPGQIGTVHKNLSAPVEETNLIGLCRRPMYSALLAAQTVSVVTPANCPSMLALLNPFAHWQGSIRYRAWTVPSNLWFKVAKYRTRAPVSFDSEVDYGVAIFDCTRNAAPTIEVPFEEANLFGEVYNTNIAATRRVQLTAASYTANIPVYMMAGDDFGVLNPLHPPFETVSTATLPGSASREEVAYRHLIGGRVFNDYPQEKTKGLVIPLSSPTIEDV